MKIETDPEQINQNLNSYQEGDALVAQAAMEDEGQQSSEAASRSIFDGFRSRVALFGATATAALLASPVSAGVAETGGTKASAIHYMKQNGKEYFGLIKKFQRDGCESTIIASTKNLKSTKRGIGTLTIGAVGGPTHDKQYVESTRKRSQGSRWCGVIGLTLDHRAFVVSYMNGKFKDPNPISSRKETIEVDGFVHKAQ